MKPCAFTASRTPIRSRTGTLQGRSDSPTWKRGNTSRSTIATVRPPRDRKVAALDAPGRGGPGRGGLERGAELLLAIEPPDHRAEPVDPEGGDRAPAQREREHEGGRGGGHRGQAQAAHVGSAPAVLDRPDRAIRDERADGQRPAGRVGALGGRERVHLAVPSPESRWTEDPDHVERGRGGLTRPARHDAGGQEGPDREAVAPGAETAAPILEVDRGDRNLEDPAPQGGGAQQHLALQHEPAVTRGHR